MSMFFKKKNKRSYKYRLNAEILARIYGIPLGLAEIILSQKKTKDPLLGDYGDPYEYEEYKLMMLGAMITYQRQELMGRMISRTDPRYIEITNLLVKLNARIQYHPRYGLIIVDNI